jgi:hypothetical protein
MSDRQALVEQLHRFVVNTLKGIDVVMKELRNSNEPLSTITIANKLYQHVEHEWKQICQNSDVADHFDTIVALGGAPMSPMDENRLVMDEKGLGMSIVKEILRYRLPDSFSPMVATEFAAKLAEFFCEDKVTLVTEAPIYGLHITHEGPVTPAHGVSLISTSEVFHKFSFLTVLLEEEFRTHAQVCFEHKWLEKKTFVEDPDEIEALQNVLADPLFERMIFVLRLLGMRNFGAPYVRNGVSGFEFLTMYRKYRFTLSSSSRCIHYSDQVDSERAKGLAIIWKVLENLLSSLNHDRTRLLVFALQKVNASCERDNSVDRLLDLCISLEALLTRESEQITFQFRQRGIFLLSLACGYLSENQLREIRKFLNDVYKTRSKLVHGETLDHSKLEETNTKLFELARIFCLKYICLANRFSKAEMLDNIDLGMASQETRKTLEDILLNSELALFWNSPFEKVTVLFRDSRFPSLTPSSC